jgi:hypothetical protein
VRHEFSGRGGHEPSHRTSSSRSIHGTGDATSSMMAAPCAGMSRGRSS